MNGQDVQGVGCASRAAVCLGSQVEIPGDCIVLDGGWLTDVHPTSIGGMVARECEFLGLPRTSVHMLRKTFATGMDAVGCPRGVLMRLLGHKGDQTTDLYARGIEADGQRWLVQLHRSGGRQISGHGSRSRRIRSHRPGNEQLLVVATEKPVSDLAGLANVVFNKPDEQLTPQEKEIKKSIKAKVHERLNSIREHQAGVTTYRGLLSEDSMRDFTREVERSGVAETAIEEPAGANTPNAFSMVASSKAIRSR